MDEDNFRRGPATSHQLEPMDDENVSKKARVAKNVLHIRGEDSVKFDVNEEAWPNADLVIRACYEGALINGLPATKSRLAMNEKSSRMKDLAAVLLGHRRLTFLPTIDPAHRLGSTNEGEVK